MRRAISNLDLGTSLWHNRDQSLASLALKNESDGLAMNFRDRSILIKDTVTPANNFSGNVNNKLVYASPSTKWILGANGFYSSGTTIRTAYSPAGAALGAWIEEARINRALWCRDLTNAAWVKTSCTAALTATGIDGVSNSATTLTATGASATCLQTIVSASAIRITSAFVRRRTGSGIIEMTQDGVTWTTITVTSSLSRFTIPTATVTNPIVGFRITTSGDAIDVDFAQIETPVDTGNLAASTPILTTTAAVTRAQDNLSLLASAFPLSATGGTLIVSGYVDPASNSTSGNHIAALSDGTNANMVHIFNASRVTTRSGGAVVADSTIGTDPVDFLTPTTLAVSYPLNAVRIAKNGVSAPEDTSAALPISMTMLRVGVRGDLSGGTEINGIVSDITYFKRSASFIETEELSGPLIVAKVVTDGNSLSTTTTYQPPLLTLLGTTYSIDSFGVGGQTTVGMTADAVTQIDPYIAFGAYAARGALIAWEGTNDIAVDDADLATMQSRWSTYFAARAAAGWNTNGNKLIAMTIIARGTFSGAQATRAADFNTWLRANYSTYATHLVDLAADSRMQNSSDLTYYNVDTVHLTATGYSVVADLIKAAVWP